MLWADITKKPFEWFFQDNSQNILCQLAEKMLDSPELVDVIRSLAGLPRTQQDLVVALIKPEIDRFRQPQPH